MVPLVSSELCLGTNCETKRDKERKRKKNNQGIIMLSGVQTSHLIIFCCTTKLQDSR